LGRIDGYITAAERETIKGSHVAQVSALCVRAPILVTLKPFFNYVASNIFKRSEAASELGKALERDSQLAEIALALARSAFRFQKLVDQFVDSEAGARSGH